MIPPCPKCGSHNVRYSHVRSAAERLASLLGVRPLRCRDCRERFSAPMLKLSDLAYARCPKCLRMDLTYWSPSYYHVSFGKGLLMSLGARPLRCERCRCNFVSFRRRKYRFRRGAHKRDAGVPPLAQPHTGHPEGSTPDGSGRN